MEVRIFRRKWYFVCDACDRSKCHKASWDFVVETFALRQSPDAALMACSHLLCSGSVLQPHEPMTIHSWVYITVFFHQISLRILQCPVKQNSHVSMLRYIRLKLQVFEHRIHKWTCCTIILLLFAWQNMSDKQIAPSISNQITKRVTTISFQYTKGWNEKRIAKRVTDQNFHPPYTAQFQTIDGRERYGRPVFWMQVDFCTILTLRKGHHTQPFVCGWSMTVQSQGERFCLGGITFTPVSTVWHPSRSPFERRAEKVPSKSNAVGSAGILKKYEAHRSHCSAKKKKRNIYIYTYIYLCVYRYYTTQMNNRRQSRHEASSSWAASATSPELPIKLRIYMPGLLKKLIHFSSLWLMAEHFACKIKCAATFLRSVLTERKQMQAVSSFSAIQTHQRISRHLQECRRRNKVSDTILAGVQWQTSRTSHGVSHVSNVSSILVFKSWVLIHHKKSLRPLFPPAALLLQHARQSLSIRHRWTFCKAGAQQNALFMLGKGWSQLVPQLSNHGSAW